MRVSKSHITIHIFAILHALTALGCRLAGLQDEYLLTLLTITMIVIICAQEDMRMVVTSCAIVFGNLAGYLIGIAIAQLMGVFNIPHLLAFPVSTIITTEMLGWMIMLACVLFEKRSNDITRREIVWMVSTCAVVYSVRLVLAICHIKGLFGHITEYEDYENVVYFLLSFCTMTLLVAITMIGYEISERKRLSQEKEKRHLAQFRYMRLNQQVNPHFLFNSLNVLDCLVTDGENQKASIYIHKLSSLYRYMLSNEDEVLVKLHEELDYVRHYVDLMQVRFPEGLEFIVDIPEEIMNSNIVPCSLQLLIENATKHNAIDKANPLIIRVSADDSGHVTVSNNLCPKLSLVTSTGKGLRYIRQQFMDISGKDIEVVRTQTDYIVKLPLL